MSRSQCEKLVKSDGVFAVMPHIGYAGIRVSLEVAGDYFVRTTSDANPNTALRDLAKSANRALITIEGRP